MTSADVHQPGSAATDTSSGTPFVEPETQQLPVIPAQRGPAPDDSPTPPATDASSMPKSRGGVVPHAVPDPGLRRSRRWVAPAVFGLVILAIGAIAAVGVTTSLARDGGSAAPAAAPVAPTAPVPVVTPQMQLLRWSASGGLSRTQAITNDLGAVGDAGQRYDISGMNTACRALQSDIEAAQAYAPIPDTQAQSTWSSALAHGARSATYCIAGTDAMSASLIQSATTEIDLMTDDLTRTTARIGVINGTN